MAKTVEDYQKALKLKAEPRNEALSIRIGSRKMVLPFEVRIINSSGYLFVHIPPSAGIMKITTKGLEQVQSESEARDAVLSFRQSKKKSGGRKSSVAEMPTELVAALSKIPSGFKLSYGPDGKPRLVKTRKRSKK